MSTSILNSYYNEDISSIINKKFASKLKTDDHSIYIPINKNTSNFYCYNKINEFEPEKNKLNKMNFLFPSIPLEVRIYLLYYYRK